MRHVLDAERKEAQSVCVVGELVTGRRDVTGASRRTGLESPLKGVVEPVDVLVIEVLLFGLFGVITPGSGPPS